MAESIYITRAEFYSFMKDVKYIAANVRALMSNKKPAKWMTQAEAMEAIGCKSRKLLQLRQSGELEWRCSEKGRGVMILRESVEKYSTKYSTLTA